MIQLVPIMDVAPASVEALLDAAFGSNRHGRTAYRIRSNAAAMPKLSLAATDDGTLVGTIQCWPIALHGDNGIIWPLIMVGPVAVVPARQGDGIGRALMDQIVALADEDPTSRPLMLIGDPIYYGRFGFSGEATRQWRAPGPVEQHRLLARGGTVPDCAGMLGPRQPQSD
ncbi:MAG: N-acetyltransferase [Sphingomonas sp.]|nr:N-acetyltransferase [Sphingomonas sp.]